MPFMETVRDTTDPKKWDSEYEDLFNRLYEFVCENIRIGMKSS